MKRINFYILSVATALIFCGAALVLFLEEDKPDINCQARTIIHDGNNVLNIKTILHMQDDDNFFELFMTYTKPSMPGQKFHRVVNFSYDKEGDIYKMFSDVTNDNALPLATRNELNDLVPDFFLMPQRGLRFKIDKTKSGNVVIINDRLPVFVCMPIDS